MHVCMATTVVRVITPPSLLVMFLGTKRTSLLKFLQRVNIQNQYKTTINVTACINSQRFKQFVAVISHSLDCKHLPHHYQTINLQQKLNYVNGSMVKSYVCSCFVTIILDENTARLFAMQFIIADQLNAANMFSQMWQLRGLVAFV